MTLRPRLRKATLALHLATSVGWIGGVIAYLALSVTAIKTTDPDTVRSAWLAMEIIGWYALVPLGVAALVTGIAMGAGTRWGLFDHYWVTISLILTSIALAVLVLHMPDVSTTADYTRTATDAQLTSLGGDIAHPSIGLAVLLIVHVLNIYKPRGRTRRGQRSAARTSIEVHEEPAAAN